MEALQRLGDHLLRLSRSLFSYAIFRLQGVLPFNPQHLPGVGPALAWNTAVSFVTNTNWQAYSGETTMSYLSQMGSLAVQNFVSAAVGIAVAVALIRGFQPARGPRPSATSGLTWSAHVLYILLPIAFVAAIVFIAQGAHPDAGAARFTSSTRSTAPTRCIPRGPVASQEAIKQLGTNGGGFFNANSAPARSRTRPALTNFLSIAADPVHPGQRSPTPSGRWSAASARGSRCSP